MQERLDCDPEIMRVRRQTVEHPYGTLKLWMGSLSFLLVLPVIIIYLTGYH